MIQNGIQIEITLETWVISDTHFFHENIGKYCNRPDNWQNKIIDNWNDLISPNEVVLHLGDFSLGPKTNFNLIKEKLNGKLLIIRGNHDRFSRTFYESCGVTLVPDPFQVNLLHHPQVLFSHRPIIPFGEGVINFHGHIHNATPTTSNPIPNSRYINMCVEVRQYRPWKLGDLLTFPVE